MKKEQRFEVTPTKADGGVSFDVVTDKQTGVQYVLASNYIGSSLTVLVDKDGKPLLKPMLSKFR